MRNASCYFLSTFKIPLRRQTALSGSTGVTSPCPCQPLSPEVFITPQSSIETRHYVTPQTSLDVNCLPTVISEEDAFSVSLNRNKTENRHTSKSNFSDFNLSQLSLNSKDDNEQEENEEKVKKKKKKKKDDQKQGFEDGMETLPILGGFTVALLVGAPVYLASNIKLAMFSAIGGGVMGYTTGKMFSDWG